MSNATPKVIKNHSTLSHNIRFLRKSKGLSQEELANELDIKRSNIAAYESKNVEPRLSIILKIAKYFDIDLQLLIESKINSLDYEKNNLDNTLLISSDSSLEIDNTEQLDEFIGKSIKIRKVLEGFKAFYDFKKENVLTDFPNKEKLLFDIDNFLQLMEHLLTYNETVIKAISNARLEHSKVNAN